MNKKLLSFYGLKWSPFSPEVPTEALYVTPRVESFCWRIEQLASEGGFGLVTGESGAGKSVTLRILAERLAAQRCQGGCVHSSPGWVGGFLSRTWRFVWCSASPSQQVCRIQGFARAMADSYRRFAFETFAHRR